MRILFDGILVLSVLILPFPFTISLVCLGFFLYPHYLEAVLVAVGIELLYRGEGAAALIGSLPLVVVALAAFVLVEILRSLIRERMT
jgi:hypothetical protein